MSRLAGVLAIATCLTFVQADEWLVTVNAQRAESRSDPVDLSLALGLGRATAASGPAVSQPATGGLPNNMNTQSPLSTAVMTTVGGRGTQFSEVSLVGDWDGREDRVADHAQKVADLSAAEPEIDATLTRTAVSAHTFANGFNENVYYYGDSVGNVIVGADTNPSVIFAGPPAVDATTLLHLPTLMNAFGSLNSDDQIVITGLCVNPVADLTSFPNVNGSFAPFAGQIGEILYVTFMDTGGGFRLSGSNEIVRSGLMAFPIADVVSPAAAPPGVHSAAGFPVTVGGGFGVAFSVFHNVAGCAVDDDGSVYFQQVDLTQFTGANIVKLTDIGTNQDRSAATNGFTTITTLNPFGGNYGSASGPASQVNRFTNFSGTSLTFGNITALAAGPGNTLYAAVAASSDGTAGSGLFANPAALGATPSMIISFTDAFGHFTAPPNVEVPDGFADVAVAATPLQAGINNFRAFALGTGPDRRTAPGTASPVFGTTANTQKVDFQVDFSIYNGLAVNEDRQVFVISGGTPGGVGRNPSPSLGEVLAFSDTSPADRRADYVDIRGNQVPRPPTSGGNVGDGDSDRFDHIYLAAPLDGVTLTPTGLAGLSRGFLRYTNRLAPNDISGLALGTTAGVQGDDQTDGPIFFTDLDPAGQASGGDDQNTPFRGDDNDGAGFPPIPPAPLVGGFEFSFGGIVAAVCTAPWNAFYLNSNGSLSFSAGVTDNTPTSAEFLAGPPRVAGAWGDLNPAARALNTNQFPVQALGFAGINHFKVKWINVPNFGREGTASHNSFSISLFDDGTGIDENANQPLNPANPIGNNFVPFDLQEGPTDLIFTTGPAGIVGNAPRQEGSSQMRLEYGWMDPADLLNEFISGYSTGAGLAQAELDLSEVGRNVLLGLGLDAAQFEQFSANDWDLRNEGQDPAASSPAGQPDGSLEIVTFFGKACAAAQFSLAVLASPNGGGSIAGTGIACPGDCTENYPAGSAQVVTATAAAGFQFSSWNGCDAPAANACTMNMTENRQVQALFTAIGPPPAPPEPLQVTLNGAAFSTGQTLIVTVTLDPSISGPGPVDAYVVFQEPGGQFFSVQPGNTIVPGIVPIATNFVPLPFSAQVLSAPLVGIPAGNFTFMSALTQPGTLNIIPNLSTASFTFTP